MATTAIVATSGSRKYAGYDPEDGEEKEKPKKPSIFKRIVLAFRRVIQQQRDAYSSQFSDKRDKRNRQSSYL